ncbi:MAG: hypothetical protein O3A47_09825 [Chloroflexi bacterium]|nr:hypothetical protein [Chloroflexota bacterium]
MNFEFVVLRIGHILSGVVWAGSAIFLAAILEPRLRTLGPEVQGRVMAALAPVLGPVLGTSALLTIAFGLTLVIRLKRFDNLLDTNWGLAISVGFVASILAFASGIITMITSRKLIGMGESIVGRPPTPEEVGRIGQLATRATLLGRATAVLVVIAVGAMASARYVG